MELPEGMTLEELRELEGSLINGLTLYEILRKPRIAKESDYQGIQISLNDSGLKEEITCAICSGIVVNCVVVKTCLHRFCSSCIEKCMRAGMNECPKCRNHIPSRRFLVPDSIYDSIISRIVTNAQVFEELSYTFTVAINKGLPDDPSLEVIRKNYLNENPKITINEPTEGESSIEGKFQYNLVSKEANKKRRRGRPRINKVPHNKILFKIVSDDTLPQIFPNSLLCDRMTTVQHLEMYIKNSLKLAPNSEISIYLKDSECVPSPDATIAFLHNENSRVSHETLSIYYGSACLKS